MATTDPDLHADAGVLFRRLYGEEPPPYAKTKDTANTLDVGDPNRVIYAPTAFIRAPGSAAFNAFELGTFTIDYGVSENLQIGVQTAIPVGAVPLGVTARVGMPFKGGAAGIHAQAMVLVPIADNDDSITIYGGGPMVTLGNRDHYFNTGVLLYAVGSGGTTDGFVIPHIGGSIRTSRRVRLGAELYIPTSTGSGPDFGEIVALLWGVRVFGESIWGDFALLELICDGCGDIYEVIPIGIPFLNFGVTW